MLHIKKNINKLCFLLAFVVCGCGGHANTHADYPISLEKKDKIISNVYGPFFHDSEVGLEELLDEYLYRFGGFIISMFTNSENKFKYEYLIWFNLQFFDQFASEPIPYIIVSFDDMRKCYMIFSLDDGSIQKSTGDNNAVSVSTRATKGEPAQYEFEITILNNPCI